MQTDAKHSPHQDQNGKGNLGSPSVENSDLERSKRLPGQNIDADEGHDGTIPRDSNAFLITFGPDDIENPLNWSTKLKWSITAAISGTGFLRIMVSTVINNLG